jgi:hypothetical protein
MRRKRGVVVPNDAHIPVRLAQGLDQPVGGLFQDGVRALLPVATAL